MVTLVFYGRKENGPMYCWRYFPVKRGALLANCHVIASSLNVLSAQRSAAKFQSWRGGTDRSSCEVSQLDLIASPEDVWPVQWQSQRKRERGSSCVRTWRKDNLKMAYDVYQAYNYYAKPLELSHRQDVVLNVIPSIVLGCTSPSRASGSEPGVMEVEKEPRLLELPVVLGINKIPNE